MNLMIDLHGTLDKYPEHFTEIIKEANERGDTVYVCSGSSIKNIKKWIDENIKESIDVKLLSIEDTVKKEFEISYAKYQFPLTNPYEYFYDRNRNFWCHDSVWNSTKGKLCKEYEISLIYDDTEEYFKYLPDGVTAILVK